MCLVGPRTVGWVGWVPQCMTSCSGSRLGVAARAGSALVWWNLRSDGSLDSRNHHAGCPVLHGNKWIANKWVKWPSQMWRYPCSREQGRHFPGIHQPAA